MSISPYLMLDGQAKEAARFYADVFDTEVLSMELAKDWPQEFEGDLSNEMGERVMHASLRIGDSNLMLADIFPDDSYSKGSSISLMADCKDTDEGQQLFDKLSEGGSVIFPFSETSFSPGYAQVTDKYGIDWQIVTDSPDMV